MLSPPLDARAVHYSEHVVDGHTFRAARWLARAGSTARPLLFFTGIGGHIDLLAPFLQRLLGRDVVTFDMPGTGGSPAFAQPYRLSAMAEVAGCILAELGYENVDVMGVSWGGMLAQEFAYRHRGQVGRLILCATSAGMPMIPGSPLTLFKMASSHRYADAATIQPYLETLYGGSPLGLDGYALRMRAPNSTGYLHQVLAIAGWTSVRKLTRVSAPALILMGEDDRLVPPANGHILKFLLPKARLEIIEGAGHLFVLTHMNAVVRTVEAFLDERLPAPSGAPSPAPELGRRTGVVGL
jgi:poly(3-hydroxyalkanoate) depolymerase